MQCDGSSVKGPPSGGGALAANRENPQSRCNFHGICAIPSDSCYTQPVPAQSAEGSYSREQLLRLSSVSERQLRAWERQKLLAPARWYGYTDLISLRALRKLKEHRLRADRLRRVVTSLRAKLGDIDNPLTELRVFWDGRKIGVQIAGRKMEPLSGQLLLDFDRAALSKMVSFPVNTGETDFKTQQQKKREAERWFQRGLELEQVGAPIEQALEAYRSAAALDPGSAGALVNLGTIYFNAQDWTEAEKHYKKALAADPEYALAHFNLGNLFDEIGDLPRAMLHYQAALQLHPQYADAHYNLALLLQGSGQTMKALQHWRIYLKLDPGSSWAQIARREMRKLREATIIAGERKEEAAPKVREMNAGVVS